MPKDVSVGEFMVQSSPFLDAVAESEKGRDLEPEFKEEVELGDEEELDDDEVGDDDTEAEGEAQADDDTSTEDDEDDDDEGEDEDAEEAEEEEEEGEVDEVVKAKKYKATLPDGSQLAITDDTTLKLKVDGKFKRIPIKELASDYNGRVKSDELIRRSSEREKELKTKLSKATGDSERAKNLTKAFLEGVTKGDLIEAMIIVNEMTGGEDPHATLTEALGGIAKSVDELASMTPEEIEKRAKSYVTDAELKKKQRNLEDLTRDEQTRVAKAKKVELCEKFDLAEDDMNASYQALVERNNTLQAQGSKPVDFSLEDVATTALEYRDWSAFHTVAKNHEIAFNSEDINNLIDLAKIETRRKGSRLAEKDYLRIAGSYANKELETLSRKVGSNKKTTPKSKGKKSKKTAVKEIVRTSQIWDT